MAWEKRRRGGRYYTRSRKVGGRVIREYVGTGLKGEMASALDAKTRMVKRRRAAVWTAQRTRVEACETRTDAFERAVMLLARTALVLAGYHQHHRGEWRRKRE